MLGLFQSYGVVVNPNDARALSQDEITRIQISHLSAMRQATYPKWEDLRNAFTPRDEAPLDERFAAFKVRLAEAIAARAKRT
jgi:hypothetical protein